MLFRKVDFERLRAPQDDGAAHKKRPLCMGKTGGE